MRINFKKFVTTSTFLIKFRYVFLSFHNEYENKSNVGFFGSTFWNWFMFCRQRLLYISKGFIYNGRSWNIIQKTLCKIALRSILHLFVEVSQWSQDPVSTIEV